MAEILSVGEQPKTKGESVALMRVSVETAVGLCPILTCASAVTRMRIARVSLPKPLVTVPAVPVKDTVCTVPSFQGLIGVQPT